MTERPSPTKVILARVALLLIVTLVLLGLLKHGISVEVLDRIGRNLVERPMGPMTFRFALQPAMAAIEAGLDGTRDARTGRSFYLWTLLTKPQERVCQLHEAFRATARVLLLGLAMDIIYQYLVFDTFHPAEAVLIALLLVHYLS